MELRRMGDSGLWVSSAGIGCNNFGMRIDEAGDEAVVDAASTPASPSSTPPTSTASRRSEEFLGRALGGRRDDVVVATKFGAMPDGGTARTRPGIAGGTSSAPSRQPAAPRHRLHRPLPVHTPDPTTPIEETLERSTDLVTGRQGPLPRLIELHRLADRRRRLDRRRPGPLPRSSPRRTSGACCAARSSARSCRPASRFGVGRAALLPARRGGSPASTGGARRPERHPLRPAIPPFSSGFSAAGWDSHRAPRGLSPTSGAPHARSSWPCRGWPGSPVVASVIAGATSPEQVAANAESIEWDLTDADRLAVDELLAAP